MTSVKTLNPKAEVLGRQAALFMNINAAKGLHDVMKTNLGPKGTIKMLVGGAGDIKLTKDGNVLLREMQIQNPTAVLIARAAVAQDDVTGDGTTTTVVLIGELMKQAERYVADGLHPRVLVDGFEAAKSATLEFLESFAAPIDVEDREALLGVSRSALRTKLRPELADSLADIVVDAVRLVRKPDEAIDLHMVELLSMRHRLDTETRLVRGLVLDHGARHPDMPRDVRDAYVLNLNLSLEYERAEAAAGFFYSSADQREALVRAERAVVDDKVRRVIELKNLVCGGKGSQGGRGSGVTGDGEGDEGEPTSAAPSAGFVVINQKGIDPESLDALARAGILALRRSKRRNAERLALACGGFVVNAVDDLSPEALGRAGHVYEHVLGDDRFTFVEDVANPRSCTVLIKAPNDHGIAQIRDATRDGLRAVKNAVDDAAIVPGAGAFEVAAAAHLRDEVARRTPGRARLGVEAFADALLGVPRILAENAGHDGQAAVAALLEARRDAPDTPVGLDLASGEPVDPTLAGIADNVIVKRQIVQSAPVIASQLLLVDEVLRAGMNMRKR